MIRYEQAAIAAKKAEANALAEFMAEFIGDDPHVYDTENGRWLTKEEIIQKTRDGWND